MHYLHLEQLFTPPPDIVMVLVAPVPEATTPAPTKSRVVAVVDKALPSSCTVTHHHHHQLS